MVRDGDLMAKFAKVTAPYLGVPVRCGAHSFRYVQPVQPMPALPPAAGINERTPPFIAIPHHEPYHFRAPVCVHVFPIRQGSDLFQRMALLCDEPYGRPDPLPNPYAQNRALKHDRYIEPCPAGHRFRSRPLKECWAARFRGHYNPLGKGIANRNPGDGG